MLKLAVSVVMCVQKVVYVSIVTNKYHECIMFLISFSIHVESALGLCF